LPIKDLDLRRLGLASIITIPVSLKLEQTLTLRDSDFQVAAGEMKWFTYGLLIAWTTIDQSLLPVNELLCISGKPCP
jgi:hypothetical protein